MMWLALPLFEIYHSHTRGSSPLDTKPDCRRIKQNSELLKQFNGRRYFIMMRDVRS